MSTDHTRVTIHESFSKAFDIVAKEGVREADRQTDF